MKAQIRAHFDGRVLVPDEPVDWPIDQPLMVSMVMRDGAAGTDAVNGAHGPNRANGHGTNGAGGAVNAAEIAERVLKIRAYFDQPSLGEIPAEALRRENIYEDRS